MPSIEETKNSDNLNFYSFFNKYSLMEDYGFTAGLVNRLFRKVLPTVPDTNTVEYILLLRENPIPYLVSQLDLSNLPNGLIPIQLNLSIKALCSKVVAFGIDSDIKAYYNSINLNSKPFESLLDKINNLSRNTKEETNDLLTSLEEIELLINELRINKHKIGTNFHLTLTTSKILEYTYRIKELLDLKLNITSRKHWKNLLSKYIVYSKSKNSIRRHIRRHSDLVALEIVEHTSNKGQKYIAENRKEYWKFFYKSLLGGGVIAAFAFIKICIDSYQLNQLWNALLFSLNYAVCFITVKQLGGIIATKQPAMTASTIAKNIDKSDDLKIDSLKSVTILVRKVFRSQFISIIGNFTMALSLACLSIYCLQLLGSENILKIVKPQYLIEKVIPSYQLFFFAAIAGFYLALAG